MMIKNLKRLGSTMKKLAAAVVFAILCIAFIAQAADEPSGLAGSWILDKEKSDANARPVMDLGAAPQGGGGMGGMGGGMPPGGMGGGMPGGGMGGGRGMGGGMPGGGAGRGGPGAGAQESKIYPVVIEQNGDQVTIATTMSMFGKEAPLTETIQCDGKEHEAMVSNPMAMMGGRGAMPGGGAQQQTQPKEVKQVTKANLKKNKLEIERKTYYQANMPEKQKRVYSLSKDGKVLTQKTTIERLTPGFGGGVATTFITEQNQVYNRQ
jgi:hypothetical protein